MIGRARNGITMNHTELSISSIIVIAAVAGYFLIPTSTTRVVEYGCSVPMTNDDKCTGIGKTGLGCSVPMPLTNDGQCTGKFIRRSALRFIVNQQTGAVAWTVDHNIGDWAISGGVLDKCAVVDSENWQCAAGVEETIGVHDGVYLRSSPGIGGYEVPGYTGWRYWRERLLMLLPK